MRSVNEDRLQKTLEYILEYQKRESKTPTYRQIQRSAITPLLVLLPLTLRDSRNAT